MKYNIQGVQKERKKNSRFRALCGGAEFLVPELQILADYNQGTGFQRDKATSHTTNISLPQKLISRSDR